MSAAIARVLVCGLLAAVGCAAVDLSKGFPFPPDTRPSGCKKYARADFANHTVSIIIPWLAEKWEHIEGTMKALLHMTPDSLVADYIWISDGNSYTYEAELKAMSPKVKVFAFEERQGLMLAKMKGVSLASGNVLVFMEAHCIVNKQWLQPILRRVVLSPRTLAMPVLDHIDQNDWHRYSPMGQGHWRYEWNFNLIYTNPGNVHVRDAEPYTSPGTSGGIFAMKKDWFEQLGLFDPGMREWGGDHMELTMKVWRCGGRIEIVPCSRVGHLYRDPEHRPYDVDVDTVVHNYKRLAELWAKDHLDIFYKMKPEAVPMKLTGMQVVKDNYDKLQKELNCKDLTWYLDNVDPEMKWEMDKVCHPFAARSDPIKCRGGAKNLVPGRWTVTREISRKEYVEARAAADARLAAEEAVRDEL